ncbi:U-box domain-containing protein 15-like [Gossypium australe]|uniref:RING-type E3 ubiquitin transferase n=1 Tax=Gossypium australe TaxID=47621 RepID=A0A5B6WMW6_9ROSI|nr:U-box domain-containing protein 15-like [Gossypium australe]
MESPIPTDLSSSEVLGDSEVAAAAAVVRELMEVIETVGSYAGFRKTQRKDCLNLVRRLKLLVPLLEEIEDQVGNPLGVSGSGMDSLVSLKKALFGAKKLLKNCNHGSKIYLAMESEAVLSRFHGVYDKLNQALDGMPYDELGVSVEVKEQVELMRMQLKRAKRRTDTQDMELAMDMMVVFSKTDDRNADIAILERLANKLELHTIADLKAETAAIRKLVKHRGGHNETVQQILDLLGKFKLIMGIDETVSLDGPISTRTLRRCQSSLIPNEFLCPITLEIMTDPVIVATGQTYERESITKWLNSNHRTCPKTGQTLDHLSLAPNFALRNLILQWCEKNNFELPKKDTYPSSDTYSADLMDEISLLAKDLSSSHPNVRRDAVMKIRMLSKENPENRISIANTGGIPGLVQLLYYPDSKIQEHAVTALLNLSIDETNKRLIAREGAIKAIIEILQNGTDEARENSAAALFSLSTLNENKILVGNFNGIPPLVNLLQNGTIRGKKDAATALFNLSLNQANKSKAIKAGIIPPLLRLLDDKNLDMVDEALSILLLLVSHPEGRNEIGRLSFVETLVGIIRSGTPKNKECAVSVLLELGLNNSSLTLAALQFGVYEPLREIAINGTNRAQRKANSLLQHMSKCEHIP